MRMSLILAATGVAMAAMSTVAGATTEAAQPLMNLKASDQGMAYCLSVENNSVAEGAKVVLWSCTLESAQNWTYTSAYQYKNAKSGKCLSTLGGGTANGTKLIQATCGGGPEQKWEKSPPTASWYALENVKSGRVLSLANNGAITNGTPAILWAYNGGGEQKWSQ
ncbi:RICIN domain-containing protein [Amycolatopsis sp. NPDC059657]|uniref:RICIN domain-containing protein n=1 Tax=Amycolatopsis sp. NPDC059657 TaxID=3346899 RepID=UPI003670195F